MPAALPVPLYRAAQVREIENAAIQRHGVSAELLMERAGRAAWDAFRATWPNAERVSIVCGSGNNGGDGYVFAQHALDHGRKVRIIALTAPHLLRGVALAAADKILGRGITLQSMSAGALETADVVIDAVFGIGLDREVGGLWRQAIESMNTSRKPILAIDIPSGLNADSGRIMGAAVHASATVTYLGLKVGLYVGEGPDFAGRVLFSDLDAPKGACEGVVASALRIDLDQFRDRLGRRRRAAHKGEFGHVLVIGGDHGFAGAARLAGEAAARIGSGLVSIATRPEHAFAISAARPELMAHGIGSASQLGPLLGRATVVAIGPGIGQSDWAQGILGRVLESSLPLVVDADALNLLARDPCRRENWIITPHPGEAARLLSLTAAEVQADRLRAVDALQSRFGGVVVLKGCGTVIGDGGGPPALCDQGNPGMASGGTGDVLCGVIAGLVAQGLDRSTAAKLGVCLHAAAGDACAVRGERGMLASDLIAELRPLANP